MSIRIVTDSTCDLPQEVIQEYGIRVVPMYIHTNGDSYLDGIDITREEFYQRLPEFDPAPTTAAPGPEKFRQIYEELAQEGASEILSIHISVSLSVVLDVARLAAKETRVVPVTVFDSRQLSLGTGFLVETAAKAAAQGQSMVAILEFLEEQISRTHVFAAQDTMEFLRRSGRISGLVAGFGSLLQVKPVLRMYEGQPTSERVRTTNGAFSRIGFSIRRFSWQPEDLDVDMSGKTCIVTGANSGLGFETSKQLAKLGARDYMLVRDPVRGEKARQEVCDYAGHSEVFLKVVDLSRLQDVRNFVGEYLGIEPGLDVLVNNAGVLQDQRECTEDGVEKTFARIFRDLSC